MRIISGIHKGRKIKAPTRLPVRPTTDRAKEALFNILHNRFVFDDIEVLDLFSGTGNISFEFGSRGVARIDSVELHRGGGAFIKKTAEELELPISVYTTDALGFLDRLTRKYDIIFADPPYDFELDSLKEIVEKVSAQNALKPGGILIIEHSSKKDLGDLPTFREVRKYGGSSFSFFGSETE